MNSLLSLGRTAWSLPRSWMPLTVVAAVLVLAASVVRWDSPLAGAGLLAVGGAVVVVQRQPLGLVALTAVALLFNYDIGTGTEVKLNPATLLVPALFGLWLLASVRHGRIQLPASATTRPLFLFLVLGLLALAIGRATWDPAVPVTPSFLLVQLAQWAIFLFSAFAFWMAASVISDETWLRRLTLVFLVVGGLLAIGIAFWGVGAVVERYSTVATFRAPFWVLLAGLVGGQLLFNRQASLPLRLMLGMILLAVGMYAFYLQREASSNWVGVGAVAGVLIWLRWPRLRWPIAFVIVLLVIAGVLLPGLYDFAGGDQEWEQSGGSRLALAERVVGVTLRNPITGLGPAAYRPYANQVPMFYGRAFWVAPVINSHNNYVDIFAHTGLVGLGLFLWFLAEVAWLGLRLHRRHTEGFVAGYVNGMLATLAGIVVIMLLLDWFVPFVYNVGFPGFQASVLSWLFLGGLVAIENWDIRAGEKGRERDREQQLNLPC